MLARAPRTRPRCPGSGLSKNPLAEFKESDFFTDAKKCLEKTGIKDVPIEDIVDIIDGYVGECYGDTWPELRQFSLGVARETGIILDTSYTCKAVYGKYPTLNFLNPILTN